MSKTWRQWWITEPGDDPGFVGYSQLPDGSRFEVIEIGAYEELEQQLQVIKNDYEAYRKSEDLRILKEFNTKYGNGDTARILKMDELQAMDFQSRNQCVEQQREIHHLKADIELLKAEARLHDTIVTQLQRGHKAYVESIDAKLATRERQLDVALESVKEVIRNSHDIIAKKRCSQALAEIENMEKEK